MKGITTRKSMRLFCRGAYLLAFTIPLIGGTANAGLFNNRKSLDNFHLNDNKFEIAESNSDDASCEPLVPSYAICFSFKPSVTDSYSSSAYHTALSRNQH